MQSVARNCVRWLSASLRGATPANRLLQELYIVKSCDKISIFVSHTHFNISGNCNTEYAQSHTQLLSVRPLQLVETATNVRPPSVGCNFSLNLQRKFLLLLCVWRGLDHKLLHTKFQTCTFLCLATVAVKVTCPNVLNSPTKICIIGRVALLVMLEADQVFLCLI